MTRRIAQQIKGKGQQGISGQNSGRFIIGSVYGRFASPQIVVVHGWQIIMHQRIGMQAL